VTSRSPDDAVASRFGPAIDARASFARVRAALAQVLAGLSAADWQQPTVCAPWLVRDVVAHILGDDLSRLSRSRDGHRAAGPAAGETLPLFLHRHNQQWVEAAASVSPVLLPDLLASVTPQVLAYWRSADMTALGEAVSWADPGPAPVWLDCARDFTEYWTHLHQILEATGRPALADDQVLHMALDTFLRALPLTLQQAAPADASGALTIRVPGPAGGAWTCRRAGSTWSWAGQPAGPGATTVSIDADLLWRLCTRGIEPARALQGAEVDGDRQLAGAALQIVSIIR
jgi:uncharacterized protein (TIGR03083 family)